MRAIKNMRFDFRSNLRAKSFVIAYWHLIAGLCSAVLHLLIVNVLTDGFQCETSKKSLRAVQWSWLETFLLIINMGAHGFYPYPLILNYHINLSIKYLPLPEDNPPCHSVMSVVTANDIMYFLFNVLWMAFVVSYIIGVHIKDPGPMVTFFIVTCIKLFLQLHGIFGMSSYGNPFLEILYKIVDICLIVIFLKVIWKYMKEVREDKNRKHPPGFLENLYIVMKRHDEIRKEKLSAISNEKHTPIEENNEKHIPIKENNERHIPIEDNNEEHIPIKENNERHIPIEDNNEKHIPIKENNERHIPIENNNEKHIPIKENNERHIPIEDNNEKHTSIQENNEKHTPVEENKEGV